MTSQFSRVFPAWKHRRLLNEAHRLCRLIASRSASADPVALTVPAGGRTERVIVCWVDAGESYQQVVGSVVYPD